MKLTRTHEERAARINALGGYQHVFDAIANAVALWPCKETASGISISVFAFVDTLDNAITPAGRQALNAGDET